MLPKENERLIGLLDEAEGALDEALPFFRRIEKCHAFGIGGMPGSRTRKDTDVVAIRNRIESFVGPLAEQIIKATDRHGRPLDFPGPIRDAEGNLQAMGARGERLCGLWLEFRSALGAHDAPGCVDALVRVRTFLSEVRRDAGATVHDADDSRAAKLSRRAARVWGHIREMPAVPTYDDLTADLQMSRDTVSKALKELRAKGYLPKKGTETEPK
jgi:DNA-binding transcriptional ArsR family regulator